jgi:hypothetical protein
MPARQDGWNCRPLHEEFVEQHDAPDLLGGPFLVIVEHALTPIEQPRHSPLHAKNNRPARQTRQR